MVKPEIHTDDEHDLVNVVFHINLNRHAKFGKVILKGAPPKRNNDFRML